MTTLVLASYIKRLRAIVDDEKLKTVWLDYKKGHSSSDVDEIIMEIHTTLEKKPELLRKNHYETHVKKACP